MWQVALPVVVVATFGQALDGQEIVGPAAVDTGGVPAVALAVDGPASLEQSYQDSGIGKGLSSHITIIGTACATWSGFRTFLLPGGATIWP